MLPTGHIAAGYLTAFATIKILKPDFDQQQINQLLALGAFCGFAPYLDVFYAFFRQRSLLVAHNSTPNHRKYFFHAPVLWLICGLAIYFLSASEFVKLFGAVLFLSS